MDKPSLLLTRPRHSAERVLARLNPAALAGWDVVISPLLAIIPLEFSADQTPVTAAVFSSANALAFVPDGGGRPAYCVGEQTSAAAQARGWRVKITAQTADDLADGLIAQMQDDQGPLTHFAGRHRRGDIAQRLTAAGLPTQVIEVYDQQLHHLSTAAQARVQGRARVLVPLFSPRTAGHFAAELINPQNVLVLAMSSAVADALGEVPDIMVQIAPAPTGKEMLNALEKQLRDHSLP
ncbi:MAG: uroporphyrinogen-III synthase [Sulfitobacter sp.]|jgi:uroporphyrinogen-III synthase